MKQFSLFTVAAAAALWAAPLAAQPAEPDRFAGWRLAPARAAVHCPNRSDNARLLSKHTGTRDGQFHWQGFEDGVRGIRCTWSTEPVAVRAVHFERRLDLAAGPVTFLAFLGTRADGSEVHGVADSRDLLPPPGGTSPSAADAPLSSLHGVNTSWLGQECRSADRRRRDRCDGFIQAIASLHRARRFPNCQMKRSAEALREAVVPRLDGFSRAPAVDTVESALRSAFPCPAAPKAPTPAPPPGNPAS